MMLTGLRIPVYYMTDEMDNMDSAGMDYPISSGFIRDMLFYHIDSISSYFDPIDNNKEYTSIHSNGTIYYTNIPMSQVKELIESHLYNSLFFLKS